MAEESYKDKLARAKSAISNLRKQGEKAMVTAMHTAEATGTAFALGAYKGYHGEAKIMDVDAALVVGIIAHAAALSGAGSESMDSHFSAIGDGALAVAAYNFGQEKGTSWKDEKDKTGEIGDARGISKALGAAEQAILRADRAAADQTGAPDGLRVYSLDRSQHCNHYSAKDSRRHSGQLVAQRKGPSHE